MTKADISKTIIKYDYQQLKLESPQTNVCFLPLRTFSNPLSLLLCQHLIGILQKLHLFLALLSTPWITQ